VRPPVVALLGPTNTGKTYLAVERMLAHRTGMMGFPLRLLARENYDRLVAAKGRDAVALVTGEERIVPRAPAYYVCTVEAMPLDRRVDFLAIDEVQLAADRERGHVFTDRLLHARGLEETMLLGAETIRPLLRLLVPDAAFITRPRLSTLTYSEPRKLSRLPRRAAVVVFSVAEVYEVAERLREHRGGAALVFGALSPRTRNAQVGLYQNGEVDYLVATDAIGMGLNLDIDHVVFTSLTKYDGLGPRHLRPAEVAQIAGRAGRHVKDGRFGPTAELGPFAPGLVEAVENHRFDPLPSVYWRNSDVSFASSRALLASLEQHPPLPQLVRMRQADDHRALAALARDPEVAALARGPESVRLLWEVCQVPDFSNVMTDDHTRLLGRMFRHLAGPGALPEDWVTSQVSGLDRTEGDVDTLLARIAAIRTWTYVSHRSSWLDDAGHWQERTRAVEDRLSDALHERLTQQFVDRRAAVIARYEPGELVAEIGDTGEVLIQGLLAGRLEGFRFAPEPSLRDGSRSVLAAANRTLRAAIGDRVERFEEDGDETLALSLAAQVAWHGGAVARLVPGEQPLAPRVEALASDLLDPPLRERVRRRAAVFVERHVRSHLAPLHQALEAELPGPARGLVFALAEALGSVPRAAVASQLAALPPGERRELYRLGITLGRRRVYVPALLRPDGMRLRALLWSVKAGRPLGAIPDGRAFLTREHSLPEGLYEACGYEIAGGCVIRVDRLERVAALAYKLGRAGAFAPTPELTALLGGRTRELAWALRALGYVPRADGRFEWSRPAADRRNAGRRRAASS
jgi:ATP-dependent RNA helicase SUPV3L1/SUV3